MHRTQVANKNLHKLSLGRTKAKPTCDCACRLQHLADTTDEAQQSINIGASSATSFYTQPPSPRTHHAGVFPSAGASLLNASGGSGEHAANGAGAVLNRNAGSFRWTIFGSAAHRTRPSVLPADDAQRACSICQLRVAATAPPPASTTTSQFSVPKLRHRRLRV